MSDKHDPKDKAVSRRETLKLATAVSALGLGLGATFSARDAGALVPAVQQKNSVSGADLGQVQIKFWKIVAGQPAQLLHGVDITSLVAPGGNVTPGTYNLKITSLKGQAETPLTDQVLTVTQLKN